MLKNILTLNGVQELNKTEQKEVNGGNPLLIHYISCDSICPTAAAGTPCGPPHCPGFCDGYGGVDRA